MAEKDYRVGQTVIKLLQGDITTMDTAAIVNAANSSLMGGGGVDGAIHRAGGPAILEECRCIISEIGRCRTGQAVMTGGGRLKARHVIHTVGPIWRGGNEEEAGLLASAYRNSLNLAGKHGIQSLSFPSISTGAYRYPAGQAAEIALKTIAENLKENPSIKEVRFVLFDRATYETYLKRAEELFGKQGGNSGCRS